MPRHRKHIKRLPLHHPVSFAAQVLQIPGQGLWIAGYIHNPLRRKLRQRGKELFVTAAAGRIKQNYIHLLSFVCKLDHKLACICLVKFDI